MEADGRQTSKRPSTSIQPFELNNFQAPEQKSYIAQTVQLHVYTDIKKIINIKPTI